MSSLRQSWTCRPSLASPAVAILRPPPGPLRVILEDDPSVVLARDGGCENRRYGGPMTSRRQGRAVGQTLRWPRTVPARVRALGPARLDALTAGLVVLATVIELPLEHPGDHAGVTYAAAIAIGAALAFRRRATFWVVALQAAVV